MRSVLGRLQDFLAAHGLDDIVMHILELAVVTEKEISTITLIMLPGIFCSFSGM